MIPSKALFGLGLLHGVASLVPCLTKLCESNHPNPGCHVPNDEVVGRRAARNLQRGHGEQNAVQKAKEGVRQCKLATKFGINANHVAARIHTLHWTSHQAVSVASQKNPAPAHLRHVAALRTPESSPGIPASAPTCSRTSVRGASSQDPDSREYGVRHAPTLQRHPSSSEPGERERGNHMSLPLELKAMLLCHTLMRACPQFFHQSTGIYAHSSRRQYTHNHTPCHLIRTRVRCLAATCAATPTQTCSHIRTQWNRISSIHSLQPSSRTWSIMNK